MLSLVLVALLYRLGYQTLQSNHMMFVKEAKESALTNKLINNHEYEFHINHESICNSDIFILFLVATDLKNFKRRQDIRNTWGAIKIYKNAKLRIAFLVGEIEPATGDLQVQLKLWEESNQYQDIVQGNFIDSYKNLTYKTVFGLHWMQMHCRNAQIVFKTDDDVVINVFRLIDFLQGLNNGVKLLRNFVYCMTTNFGRARRGKSKVHTSYSEYQYFWFPVYCHGPGYLMSNDVAVRLYNATQYIPFLWLEDVFIGFGMSMLELKITDNYFGFFVDIDNQFYKIIELCILKHLGKSKSNLSENWERIVLAQENRFTMYFIHFKLMGISSLIVMTICVCALYLKLAKKRFNDVVIYFCSRT